MKRKLRAVIVTDIHYGRDAGNKLGGAAPLLLRNLARFAAAQKPDILIDLGDRISLHSHAEDMKNMQGLAAYFNAMACPRIHVTGNHDIRFLSRAENESIMGTPAGSYSADAGDFRLIAWNPHICYETSRIVKVGQSDIDWLENAIASSAKPVIVLSHMPLDYTGTPVQDALNEHGALYFKRYDCCGRVRRIMEDSGKVVMCLAGDQHRNARAEINGIHYLTIHSLTQRAKGMPYPNGAFALLEIEGDDISVNLYGLEPRAYRLKGKPQLSS